MREKVDTSLVTRILKGDTQAFEVIVAKYEKPIFNLVYRMTNHYEDTLDITQCVFIKAYERLESYNPSYKFFSWLYRIAVNECINFSSRKRNMEPIEPNLPVRGHNPEEELVQNEVTDSLQKALMNLNYDYRAILVLKHFNDFSYKEISEILQIPEKTVKSRLFTGRKLLKNVLLEQGFAL